MKEKRVKRQKLRMRVSKEEIVMQTKGEKERGVFLGRRILGCGEKEKNSE